VNNRGIAALIHRDPGAVIVGVVSVAAALTLLPAMLSLIGDRVNSLPLPVVGKNLGRSGAAEARIWTAVTRRVMRRPAVSLALAGGVMVLAAVPVLGLHIGRLLSCRYQPDSLRAGIRAGTQLPSADPSGHPAEHLELARTPPQAPSSDKPVTVARRL
jgi:hypothetical protein